jgi:hypothetical protein
MLNVHFVNSFEELICTPFHGDINAICWQRETKGDFSEIVSNLTLNDNIRVLEQNDLLEMDLSADGILARENMLSDLKLLEVYGAAPVLNFIKYYEQDESYPFFPTDVYSFHVDRSPIPTDTFLCTYFGEPSDIIPNSDAEQKILIPAIRAELRKLHDGPEEAFDAFLVEHFFDLHYQAKQGAVPISLGIANMWRLSVDYPGNPVLPCVHRAPKEKDRTRLLLIC